MPDTEVLLMVKRETGDIDVGTAMPLGGGLYITARHMVPNDLAGKPYIRLTPGAEPTECETVWRSADSNVDVALLSDPSRSQKVSDVTRCGRLRGTAAHQCDLVGYPVFAAREVVDQGGARRRRELARIKGTVILPSGVDGGVLLFDITGPLPRGDLNQHGMGLSGAPMYCQGLLVGILVASDGRFEGRRLIAVSMATLIQDEDFARYLQNHLGRSIEVLDLEAFDERSVAEVAIQEVAKTDPRNIQEVAAAQFGLSDAYYKNVLSQAQKSFLAAVVAASVGTTFLLVAVLIALLTDTAGAAAIVSAVSGSIVEAVAGLNFWLYSRTSAQLNAFHVRLERMQKLLLANSVCANIPEDQRGPVMADLVRSIAQESPDSSSQIP